MDALQVPHLNEFTLLEIRIRDGRVVGECMEELEAAENGDTKDQEDDRLSLFIQMVDADLLDFIEDESEQDEAEEKWQEVVIQIHHTRNL